MCKATGIRDTGLMDWRKECKDAPQDGSAMRITLEREREGEGEGEEEGKRGEDERKFCNVDINFLN